jgi:dihydroorotate dehydrogenase (NAD+) catalytic subunit
VIGVGGIMNAEDALEFICAGAAAVQLGTVNYVRPQAAAEIREGIAAYLVKHDLPDMRALPIRPAGMLSHV